METIWPLLFHSIQFRVIFHLFSRGKLIYWSFSVTKLYCLLTLPCLQFRWDHLLRFGVDVFFSLFKSCMWRACYIRIALLFFNVGFLKSLCPYHLVNFFDFLFQFILVLKIWNIFQHTLYQLLPFLNTKRIF